MSSAVVLLFQLVAWTVKQTSVLENQGFMQNQGFNATTKKKDLDTH